MIGMNCARTDPQVELSHGSESEEEGLQPRRRCAHNYYIYYCSFVDGMEQLYAIISFNIC